MRMVKSAVYDRFSCIAGQCPDSCCQEWEVEVDRERAEEYRNLEGPLGDRLRQVMQTDHNGNVSFCIENRRCPMWRQDGLCQIQAELGHEALCKTCREFPRLRHDYGDFVELGLELSCPEAARLMLTADYRPQASFETAEIGQSEYDEADMAVLLKTRQKALEILCSGRPVQEALTLLLLYGYEAQGQLDGGEEQPFSEENALQEAREFAKPGEIQDVLDFFAELEILTENWEKRLKVPEHSPWCEELRRMAAYFVERYWLQAISDFDLVGRVKLTVIACLIVRALGGDTVQTAQQFSKEIENSDENVEAVLDGAYTHPALTDDKLLYLLMTDR